MNTKIKILIIWIIGNLLFLGKYFQDKLTIRCEPCLANTYCPPCQTDYMKDIWTYFIIWNIITIVFGLLWLQVKKKNVW